MYPSNNRCNPGGYLPEFSSALTAQLPVSLEPPEIALQCVKVIWNNISPHAVYAFLTLMRWNQLPTGAHMELSMLHNFKLLFYKAIDMYS